MRELNSADGGIMATPEAARELLARWLRRVTWQYEHRN